MFTYLVELFYSDGVSINVHTIAKDDEQALEHALELAEEQFGRGVREYDGSRLDWFEELT